jgi:hypothetical protein
MVVRITTRKSYTVNIIILMLAIIEVPTYVAVEQRRVILGQHGIRTSSTPKRVVLNAKVDLGLFQNKYIKEIEIIV